MTDSLSLSEAEWTLLLELLEAERRDLPSEIRRSDVQRVHDQLHERLALVDELIERMKAAPVG